MNNDSPKNVRSFWSDLERAKADDPGSSPASSMSSPRTPLLNSVKNSTFIISDRSPKQSFNTSPTLTFSSSPRQQSFGSRQKHSISPSPNNQQKPVASISPEINSDSSSSQSPKPPQFVNRNIALLKKSSLLRTGSVGRLQGPRTIGSSSNLKPKKVVKFEQAAPQVIQYETLTPELSLKVMNGTQFSDQDDPENTYNYENRRFSQESDSHSLLEDDGYNSIPVVEPPLYGIAISSPIPGFAAQEDDRPDSASRRPLPQIPPDSASSSPVEKMSPSPNSSGTVWTIAPFSPSDSPLMNSSNVFRQSSLLDSQHKIVTLHHSGQSQLPTHVEINPSVPQQRRSLVEHWNKGSDESSSPELTTKKLPAPPGPDSYYGRALPAIKEDTLSREVYENYDDYKNVDPNEEYNLYHNNSQYDRHEYDDPYYDQENLNHDYPDRHYGYDDHEEVDYHPTYENNHYPYDSYYHPRHSSEGYRSRHSSESYQRSHHSSGRDSQHSYHESYDERSLSRQELEVRDEYRENYREARHTPEIIRRSLPITPDSPHHSLHSHERSMIDEVPLDQRESYDTRPSSRRGLGYEDLPDPHEYPEDIPQENYKEDYHGDSDDSRFQDHEPENSDDSYEDLPDDQDYEAEAEFNSEDENDEDDFEKEDTAHLHDNDHQSEEEDIPLEDESSHSDSKGGENEEEEEEPAFHHGYRTVSNSNNDPSFHQHYREFSPSQQDIPRDASFIHHPQDYPEPDYSAEEPVPNISDYYDVPIKKELIDELPLSKLSLEEPTSLPSISAVPKPSQISTTTTSQLQDYSGQESSSPDINYPIGHPRSRVTSRSVSRSTSRSMSKIVSVKQEPEDEDFHRPSPSFAGNSSISHHSFENQSTTGFLSSKTPEAQDSSVEPRIKNEPIDDYPTLPESFNIKQEPMDEVYQNIKIKKEPYEEQSQNSYLSNYQSQYAFPTQTGNATMNPNVYTQNEKQSENYYIKQEPVLPEDYQHQSKEQQSTLNQFKDVQQPMLSPLPCINTPNQLSETAVTESPVNEEISVQNGYQDQDQNHEDRDEQDQFQNTEIPLNEPQTIVATGTNLRARPSLTPGDVSKFSELNDSLQNRTSTENDQPSDTSHIMNEISKVPVPMLTFDFDDIVSESESIFGDLDKEFDKVLNTEKRGYKIREAHEVVVATGERKRTEAQRAVSGPVKKFNPITASPVPPMPKINLEEHQAPVKSNRRKSTLLDTDRGRLFVRVLKLSKVLLPGLETKNANYYMVLDNGLHSITTPLKPFRKESFLEQEFELVVGTNLEFILTCKAKWPKVASSPLLDNVSIAPSTRSLASRASITSTARSEKPRSGFSKLFSKKKNLAFDSIRPVASGRSVMSNATAVPQIRKDPWEDLTAVDGSFGRIYIALSQYENEIYGRAATFEIPLYNEWSTNHISLSGIGKKVKKEPYQIGTLQVQMMFVPRASKTEELPGSIKEALNDLRDASKIRERNSKPVVIDDNDNEEEEIKFNGYLSQLGGDCKYWRRRFFVLDETTLTAFSETSHKPRAVVNLKKAIRIIQDKDTLIKPSSDKRRKSGFAENEDGYLFADQGFRISFLNGEVIEFYGDNKADWVQYLNKVIDAKDVLLAKEQKRRQNFEQGQNDLAKEKPWVSLLLDSNT